MLRLDLTSLQLFVAVCEEGSIGRAAEREHLTASAVSKRLAELEERFGLELLHRHARGVEPSPAGAALLHHARALMRQSEVLCSEMGDFSSGVKGHVRLYANISAIVEFLPEQLSTFIARYPDVRVDLEEHVSSAVVKAVEEGATDLGVCAGAEDSRQLQAAPYGNDDLLVIVKAGHPLAAGVGTTFAQTLGFDHVGLHSNSAISKQLRFVAAQADRMHRVRVRVTGFDAMCRMIDQGLGIGIMPDRAFALLRHGFDLAGVRLEEPWGLRRLKMVARDFRALPVCARLFVEHVFGRLPLVGDGGAP